MRPFIIAAGLAAILGGLALSGAARADDFSGAGAHPRSAVAADPAGGLPYMPPVETAAPARPAPAGSAAGVFDTTTRSHGHP